MATTTIEALPNELIEQIATYLDWDPTTSLAPTRPDVRNFSLDLAPMPSSGSPRRCIATLRSA